MRARTVSRGLVWVVVGGLAATWTAAGARSQAPARTVSSSRPVTQPYSVPVGRGEILHVESTGSGDAIVVLPGLFGSAFGFRNVVAPLAQAGHRVVVIEPLGIGASTRPRGADYSLEAQARRVAAVMDTLHLGSATVLAHSVGASVAFRLALARPALVDGIVSIEGGIAEGAGTPGLKSALSFASLAGHFGLQGMVRGKLRGKIRDSCGDPSWATDAVMDSYLAPLKGAFQDVIGGYKAMASAAEPLALAPRLPRLHLPVELLLGTAEHDGGPGEPELGTMRARIAGLLVVRVPGAGHWIQEEQPRAVIEAVNRIAR